VAVVRPYRWFWVLTVVVVMFQLIVVQAMVASPTLHDHCHDHSHEPDHACAVTLILSGGYDCSVPDIVPVTISTETPDVPVSAPTTAATVAGHLLRWILAHAPPRGP
jgi:hypothetical protein